MANKRGRRSRFDKEAQADAVRLLRQGDVTQDELAKGLGVSARTLRHWVKKFDEAECATPLTADERRELKRLRREHARLQEENEILKKVAAYSGKRQR